MADSFDCFWFENDYIRDIDGDGENELLCNVIWGDGAYRGVGSYGCLFSGEENVVHIWFWKEALDDYEEKQYAVDLDK